MTDIDLPKRNRNCAVPGCDVNKKQRPDIGFFCLPKNPQRAQYWLEQICIEQRNGVYVCENHFEEAVINRTNPLKRRLNTDAVPTLSLPTRTATKPSNIYLQTTEQPAKLIKSSQQQEREISRDASPPEKIKKTESNPLRSLEGGAVLSLQFPSSSSSKPLSKPNSITTETTKQNSSSKILPLKIIEDEMIEDVHKDNSHSKPKEKPTKLVDLTSIEPMTQKIIKINEETPKETVEPVVIKKAAPTSNSMQKPQAQAQTNTIAGTTLVNTERLHETIKGASTYTLKLHEIQMKMEEISSSSKAYKQLSLKLYLKFPNEYKALHKTLSAPPKSELKCVFEDSIISIERSSLFMLYLTQKANIMTPKQKQCFLSIGESKIKPRFYYDIKKDQLLGINDVNDVLKPEPATTALVLIAQGIFEEWKQPVAVGYLANDPPSMKPWIDKNIKMLFEIGFHVRAVVFHKGLNLFSKDSFFINNEKIYCFHDLSYLLTSFYYTFTKFDYRFNDLIAKSQHIMDYYKVDSKKIIPLTPKLNHKLLKPTNFEELNVKSVMEVFSMTTAAAISAYIDFNLLDKSAEPTVELITKISKLFDILNTGGCLGDESKGFRGEPSQIEYLEEMMELFDNIKLGNPSIEFSYADSLNNTLERFKILIRCILSLWENLKYRNYEYLPIWRFSVDATELFFLQVQKHSKSITKPTAKDIDSIFRQTAIIHLLKNPVKNFKPIQMDNLLTEIQRTIKAFKILQDDYVKLDTYYKISSSEYDSLEMNRNDGIVFFAGFLLKKCISIHNCDDLKTYTRKTVCDVETLSMCESIMEDVKNNVCVLPGSEIIEFVESMEISFRTFMQKEILGAINKKIFNSLVKYLHNFEVPMPCPCFPVDYAKKLYVRFRLYHTLKYNNELNKTKLHRRLIVNKL